MNKYIISQSVDLNLEWVFEAESREEAVEKARENFHSAKVVSIEVLDWDLPYDFSDLKGEISFITPEERALWEAVGIL